MTTMHISLPEAMKAWIEQRLKEGGFDSASDYVRHLIRKDQEREAAIGILQAAIDEGVASGAPEPFDMERFKARMHRRHGR